MTYWIQQIVMFTRSPFIHCTHFWLHTAIYERKLHNVLLLNILCEAIASEGACNWCRPVPLEPLQCGFSEDWSKQLQKRPCPPLFNPRLICLSLISTMKPRTPKELCWFSSSRVVQISPLSFLPFADFDFSILQLGSMKHKSWGTAVSQSTEQT